MSFDRIPAEMRQRPQWIDWRYEHRAGTSKPTKVPYSPRSGNHADVTNDATWGTYDEALAAHASGNFDGIGFVFSANDPFVGIDLDDADGDVDAKAIQDRIYDEFESYAELSPSGKGLHIMLRGSVPQGRRRGKVEIYSTDRFFTMTGNVYRDAPIAEAGEKLAVLWSEMAPNTPTNLDVTSHFSKATESDETIYNRAATATNGDKFFRLWNGNPSDLMGDKSGSAIDQALVNMLAYYSKDPAQIERLWLRSPQGQRDKTQQRADYRQSTIHRAFDRELPTMDFSHLFKKPEGELPVVMAATLHGKPVTPRAWHVAEMIPANTVTLFGGDGGTGKSLAALQLAVATVLGRAWFGVPIQRPGGALYVSAEDDLDEIHRRLADIAVSEYVKLADFGGLAISSLAGLDALLAVPGQAGRVLMPTGGYAALRAYIEATRPKVVILDTLADLFGGDEINRAQVRQFVGMLRSIAIDYETTVILLAHPSVAGMKDNTGLSGSTAWNNSVRSRLYMKRENDQSDVRVIEVKKANYGVVGQQIRVKWERGAFCLLGHVGSANEHRQAANQTADELFLELLADFTAKGRALSPQYQSPTRYAPRLMSKHPKANGTTESGFKLAMVRLFAESRIEEAMERINRRETLTIRVRSE
jgi:RecA-family ATPase